MKKYRKVLAQLIIEVDPRLAISQQVDQALDVAERVSNVDAVARFALCMADDVLYDVNSLFPLKGLNDVPVSAAFPGQEPA